MSKAQKFYVLGLHMWNFIHFIPWSLNPLLEGVRAETERALARISDIEANLSSPDS